jgi:steroid 5-alpha reductase family enzyme
LGFSLEATADWQKSAWRADPAHKGRFIDTGLWSLARHPNYAGEMTLWWGAAIIASGGLSGGAALAACASPVFVAALLLRVSGVPMLEAAAAARWGGEAEWHAYRRRTHLLLPLPRL